MKKLSILLLSAMTLSARGENILNTLNSFQSNIKPADSVNSGSPSVTSPSKPEVKPSRDSSVSSSLKCEEDDQTSLPLAFITSLIQQKEGALNISHYPAEGSLKIELPSMISKCN
jgi:hypothetical protein